MADQDRTEPTVPVGLEQAIHSGRLAADCLEGGRLGGAGELLRSLVEVSHDRFLTPRERLREIGLRTADRVVQRLNRVLGERWHTDVSGLPWGLFTELAGQLSREIGFGSLTLEADEDSGVVRVIAWDSPFPEVLRDAGPACSAIEGFVVSLLDAVSAASLDGLETECKGTGEGVCRFAMGPAQALRAHAGGR